MFGCGSGHRRRTLRPRDPAAQPLGAKTSLRELGHPSLEDALAYPDLLAEQKPEKLERAAVRWHGRLETAAAQRQSHRPTSPSKNAPTLKRMAKIARSHHVEPSASPKPQPATVVAIWTTTGFRRVQPGRSVKPRCQASCSSGATSRPVRR